MIEEAENKQRKKKEEKTMTNKEEEEKKTLKFCENQRTNNKNHTKNEEEIQQ